MTRRKCPQWGHNDSLDVIDYALFLGDKADVSGLFFIAIQR